MLARLVLLFFLFLNLVLLFPLPLCIAQVAPSKSPTSTPTMAPTQAPTTFLIPGAAVFKYTGGPQSYVVPPGVHYLQVEACGGAGFRIGGYISATIPVVPGATLWAYVGASVTSGGYNGGGYNGGAGGTDLRSQYGGLDGSGNVKSRMIVAGGGSCGPGGGSVGGNCYSDGPGMDASGGSQTAGGAGSSFGFGCESGKLWGGGGCGKLWGGGGGGGYYGGGAGTQGGGGGSSWAMSNATITANAQGFLDCLGDGIMYISTASSMAPSPQPSPMPTHEPSSVPTFMPTSLNVPSGNSVGFYYTGNEQSWTIPANVNYIQVDACGGGFSFNDNGVLGSNGAGKGGFVSAVIPVTPSSTLWIYVGGGNGNPFPNGGDGGLGKGAGSTDIRSSFGGSDGALDVASRLVVAGGSGGDSGNCWEGVCCGGSGGGMNAGNGTNPNFQYDGTGASQGSGGVGVWCPGKGSFSSGQSCYNGAGGGGGYWGGGAGRYCGGGGSSWVTPLGVVKANVAGDSRCGGNGALIITTTSSLAPTPAPTTHNKFTTSSPTLSPTRAPTYKPGAPTPRPTLRPTPTPSVTGKPTSTQQQGNANSSPSSQVSSKMSKGKVQTIATICVIVPLFFVLAFFMYRKYQAQLLDKFMMNSASVSPNVPLGHAVAPIAPAARNPMTGGEAHNSSFQL